VRRRRRRRRWSTLELTGTTIAGFTGKAGLLNIGEAALCEVCLGVSG